MFELMKSLININREAYEKYEQFIRENKPDLIIYDSMCSFAKNICIKNNIKSICFVTTLAFNAPVIFSSNIGRTSIDVFLKNILEVRKMKKQEKEFRNKNKLKKMNLIDLFMNKADKTIVFTPKEFQPLAWTFSKNFYFVGTTIKDRKLINSEFKNYNHYDYYISFGTIFNERKSELQKLIDYYSKKDNKVILSVGNSKLVNNSENIVIEKKVNQIELLPKCDYFINHAGLNSVLESIYYKVPQICIPMQEEEKFVAKIVDKKKLGIYMKNGLNDLEKIRNFKNSYEIKKMSEILKKYDGTNLAVDIIENYMEGKKYE